MIAKIIAAIIIGFLAGILISTRAMQKIKDGYVKSGYMINRDQAYQVTKVDRGEE